MAADRLIWGRYDQEEQLTVRRRGRWVTTKVCELYLQEVLYTTYTAKLDGKIRDKIQKLAGTFPLVLTKAIGLLRGAIPMQVWFRLFQAEDNEELGTDGDEWQTNPAFLTKTCEAGAGNLRRAVKTDSNASCLYIYIYPTGCV